MKINPESRDSVVKNYAFRTDLISRVSQRWRDTVKSFTHAPETE